MPVVIKSANHFQSFVEDRLFGVITVALCSTLGQCTISEYQSRKKVNHCINAKGTSITTSGNTSFTNNSINHNTFSTNK